MLSANVIVLVSFWIPVAASQVAPEPACSRFHYEEQLLKKMVRMEFNMERVLERVDAVQEATRNTSAIIDKKISEAISKPEVKDKDKRVFGSVYTRWGRSSCPTGSVYLYDGFVAGGHYEHNGGGVNYLCLPKDPVWADGNPTAGTTGLIYGTEYETSDSSIWTHINEQEAPCAVCQSSGPTMMIPARKVCYDGWRLEYHGYLMTSYYGHVGSKEYVCVDAEATEAQGSSAANENGALFYFVKPSCGALKCPPYDGNQLLTCAVCMRAQ